VAGTRGSTEGRGIAVVKTNYLTDSCTYTHRVHIKDQGKEGVNWMVRYLLLLPLSTLMNKENRPIGCTCSPD
jgi:hypothetical protein